MPSFYSQATSEKSLPNNLEKGTGKESAYPMKELGGGMVAIACGSMAGILPTSATHSPAPPLLATPSPFSFSVASTRWSSRPSIYISSLFLRFLALIFSFASALALAAPSAKKTTGKDDSSFSDYPELFFIVTILAFVYSAYQLFKGVSDIAYRGILISDMASDYLSFILDQLAGYLLISSSSMTVLAIQQRRQDTLWKAAVISVTMSFAAFVVIAICALLSGYKLCKRIIW
ncbi:CASP-like protein 4A4 isoform X2 [Rhododendron vialii]|uniref:CASP-like protein 4A4 isoform X2 n=1 Tax=Rhododendron vialii TaxID=182163 RepID=UPI00265F19CD|nr:CASP-like protein 4A4 isoform X2 [Rhododendron vialii]